MKQGTAEKAQGIREVGFSNRRAAEDYLSSMADCIADVRFTGEPREFRISYAGGALGRCALHRARVSSMAWSVAESNEVHLLVLQRGSITVRSTGGSTVQAVAQRTAMLLPPAARGEVDVAPDTMGVSLIAPWADILAHAGRLLGREPAAARTQPMAVEAREMSDPLLAAIARNAVTAMQEMISLGDAGLSELVRAQLDEMLLGLLTAAALPEVRSSLGQPEAVAGSGIVRRAQEFIRANAADPLRLADLAESLGVGMRALQIAFRRQTGASPRDFLMSCRLELARARLISGDQSTRISSVAFDSGFTDLALFSRKYRQAFGELPSATLRKR